MNLALALPLLLVLMLLASITTFNVSRRWYVPMALVWSVAFLLFGRLVGLSWEQLGIASWQAGLLWGGGCVLVVSIGMALGVAVPRLHPLFADERVLRASGAQLALKTLIEVPLGTVVLEEVIFRSVLLGLLIRSFGTLLGVVGSAFLFGLWHILPALEMHDAHTLAKQLGQGWRGKITTVLGTILATGSAGILFALLVVGSGSILAPIGLHWAMNSTGSIAAWLVGRRNGNGTPDKASEETPDDPAPTASGDPAGADA